MPTATLICNTCRQDPKKLRKARSKMFNRADTLIEHNRKFNPLWPYGDIMFIEENYE